MGDPTNRGVERYFLGSFASSRSISCHVRSTARPSSQTMIRVPWCRARSITLAAACRKAASTFSDSESQVLSVNGLVLDTAFDLGE
jgi:hypothetical protein